MRYKKRKFDDPNAEMDGISRLLRSKQKQTTTIPILDIYSESFPDLSQLAQAKVIDSISMIFYIVKPDSRLHMFNF